MIAGMESLKTIEKVKPEAVNKPENVYFPYKIPL